MSIDIIRNAAALGALALLAVASPVQSEPQQAFWKSQEIRFVYRGQITVYDCNVLVQKVSQMLAAVGVHRTTRIDAESCNVMQPFGGAPAQLASMRIDVTSAALVTPDSAAELARHSGKQALLDRLGVQRAPTQAFPAHWQSTDLVRIRQLKLRASDCELLRQFSEQVLDKLAIEIVERDASCSRSPQRLRKPILRILTLVPAASPDSNISLARD